MNGTTKSIRANTEIWTVYFGADPNLPQKGVDESFSALLETDDVRIERIISHGHSTPAEFWFEQDQHEWVIVLQGAARLRFEHETIEMRPGDFKHIPAHTKHRVEWTTPDEPTIWLAVFHRSMDGR